MVRRVLVGVNGWVGGCWWRLMDGLGRVSVGIDRWVMGGLKGELWLV